LNKAGRPSERIHYRKDSDMSPTITHPTPDVDAAERQAALSRCLDGALIVLTELDETYDQQAGYLDPAEVLDPDTVWPAWSELIELADKLHDKLLVLAAYEQGHAQVVDQQLHNAVAGVLDGIDVEQVTR